MSKIKALDPDRFMVVEVALIDKADWNYKEEAEDKSEQLEAMMQRYGVIINLLVREKENGRYEAIDGNHRIDILNENDVKLVMVYNLGLISKEEAMAIAININELRFRADKTKLAANVKLISEELGSNEVEDMLFYNKSQIDKMIDQVNGVDNPDGERKTFKVQGVAPETFEQFDQWCDRVQKLTGFDNKAKALEYAIAEAMNLPDDSIK